MRIFYSCSIPLLCVSLVLPSEVGAQSKGGALAGIWVFNAMESRDSIDSPAEGDRSVPRPPGTAGGVRVGGGSAPGPVGGFGWPRGFDPETQRQAARVVGTRVERWVVVVNADTVVLNADGGDPYTLVVNGKKSMRRWMGGVLVEVKVSWKDSQLHIERKFENELKVTDRFSLEPESGRLIVTTKASGPIFRELTAKRVYDRASG
jgi:hypothetical protein